MSSLSSLEETNSHISLNSISSDDDNEDFIDDNNHKLNKKKKTLGRVKIEMAYINNKIRRYTTFSKRKSGIMKKAYELATLTGTEVMLLVASETGHVYTYATSKLKPIITSETGKALIQTCLEKDDIPISTTLNNNHVILSDDNNQEKKRIHLLEDDETSQPIKQIKLQSSDQIEQINPPTVTVPLSYLINNPNSQQQATNNSFSFTIDLKTNELIPSSYSQPLSIPSDTPVILTLNNFPYQTS